jgi:hypothetical protein
MLPLLALKARTFWQIFLMVQSCGGRIQTLNLGMMCHACAMSSSMKNDNIVLPISFPGAAEAE